MKAEITVRKLHEDDKYTDDYNGDPVECLDIVERLRIESGKFIYEYPAAFRRVVKIIRRKPS
ncbi:MAG: hypothetical protein JW913_03310 [Chitinispirillaceae bacterium]|nr:hypothetical protein [Chitinispirillaceae bacterium]